MSQSPLPKAIKKIFSKQEPKEQKPEGMGFPQAIQHVINGEKIRRLEWEDPQYYCFINGDILSIHKPDGNNHQLILRDCDMFADDWIVIEARSPDKVSQSALTPS